MAIWSPSIVNCFSFKLKPEFLDEVVAFIIDEDEGWEVVMGGGAYGRSYLKYTGDPEDNHLEYKIPSTLDGEYEIYAFQQGNGCKETTFKIEVGDEAKTVVFDRASLVVEGQTRGEWVSLGTYNLEKGKTGRLRFLSDDPDIHADAVLIMRVY